MRANEKETKCQPLARARHSELNLEKTFGRRPHPPRVQPHATAMTAVAGTTRPYIITIIWTTDAMGGTWPTPTGGKMDCLVVGRRRARTKYLPMLSDLFRRETSKRGEKTNKNAHPFLNWTDADIHRELIAVSSRHQKQWRGAGRRRHFCRPGCSTAVA